MFKRQIHIRLTVHEFSHSHTDFLLSLNSVVPTVLFLTNVIFEPIATVHEFHLHYSDFYDCGFKSLVMVAFVNGFFNPESRKIFVKEGYFVIFKEKKIAHCIGVW